MNTRTAAALSIVLATYGLAADAEPPRRFMGGPVTLEDQGSFFVGGVSKITEHASTPLAPPGQPPPGPTPQQITIGQMYVQFQIPARQSGSGWPVIMVHGSTHTGAALESTPDGREGWYPYFVRRGIPTYVVDQSGRGRSGFDQSVLHEAEALLTAGDATAAAELLPAMQRITNNGAWTAWFGHLVPAGSNVTNGRLILHGEAGDPDLGTASAPHVAPMFPMEAVAEYYKQLVPNAEATLPGSTCMSCDAASADAREHLDAAELGNARRTAWRRDRRHALAVRNHGPSHGAHPEGTRAPGSGESAHNSRGRLLAAG